MTKKKKQTKSKLYHHAKHLFVPHKGNQYRPHLIRVSGLTIVIALALVIQLGYGFISKGKVEVLGRVSDISVSGLLADTNNERKQAGLASLTLNEQLNQAAFLKAKDMFAYNYWAHVSPTGVSPWKWLASVNYNYDVAGENLAKNYTNADATVAAWMASPTHRANILGDKYKDVGFAVVEDVLNGRETTIVVAFYGRAATDGAVASANDTKSIYTPPVTNSIGNPLVYFGSAIQSLSPATIGVIALLMIVGVVAALAHSYRDKLPKNLRKSWRLHHGAYKVAGITVAVIVIILSTGGGQI